MATNTIDTVFGFGEDALPNLYEISVVEYPKNFKKNDKPLDLASSGRIQNFTIEGNKVESYERHYKTQKVLIPNGKIALSKEVTFQLRVDKDYKFYNVVSEWINQANSSKQEMFLGSIDDYLGTIVVSRVGSNLKPIDTSKGKNTGWKLHYVWPKSIGDLPLDWANGEAITVDVTLAYGWIEVLNQSITKDAGSLKSSKVTQSDFAVT